MNLTQQTQNFYKQLMKNDFISSHDFNLFYFPNQQFVTLSSSLRSKNTQEITVAFNIHDDSPNEVELVIQLLNKISLETVRIIGEELVEISKTDINIYTEPGCISMNSYYDINDSDRIIKVFETTLLMFGCISYFFTTYP